MRVPSTQLLADSGSQVNTVMPSYVHQHEFPILPLGELVDHPPKLNRVGWHEDETCWLGDPVGSSQ